MDRNTKKIICTAYSKGRKHDFKLFKESKTYIHPSIKTQVDTGFQGLQKGHANTEMPKKRSKKKPLTKEDKSITEESPHKGLLLRMLSVNLRYSG